ncbi:MAG TPA: DNA polymerase/3'-5' exonuclease PolX, partial [Steroidobacteraceae bacterium]|nr:DNA polymerase/3'-5' exonuclease PolX [Steroidobacteraceae bacterium]
MNRISDQPSSPPPKTATTLHNEDVASAFDEMADLLDIQAENTFRVRAYRRAAQIVRSLPRQLAEMHGTDEFDALPGIGADLARKIDELLRTGRLRALESERHRVPQGLRELLGIPSLGPVRVRALFTELKVKGIEDLRRALDQGLVAEVRGFGPGICRRLTQALAERTSTRRVPLYVASQYAAPLKTFLESLPGVTQVEVAGSYRRGRDTVGDLDLLVCAGKGSRPLEAVRNYGDLRELIAAGSTKASGVLRNGLQVDLRVLRPESFGSALHYFTGSREHNIHLRRRAQQLGYRLSEYGLFRGDVRIAGSTEEGLFKALGLPWIPPELREDRGEIEAAERNALPRLIEGARLRGDLHVHTAASDGADSLEKMVAAAQARGYSYMAITDHSRYLGVTRGLDARRLGQQMEAIDALNEKLTGFTVLKGAEVDILEDGSLAVPDEVLRRLDLVVIAVHTQLGLSEVKQTTRILRALERPCVSILAHPFGRLLGERAPCALDFERVLRSTRERGCYLEINSQPSRLDLDDVHAKAARDQGILLSISSDAHSVDQLAFVEHGVRQARRAWIEPQNVLNARPL